MAQNRLGGPGIGLPYPQPLYPASLIGSAPTPAANAISLGYGESLTIPPGDWMVAGAPVQWLDPVTGTWLYMGASNTTAGWYVHSDGQNFRIINPQGVVSAATVTAAGTGYAASTTTVLASAGGSTWLPIVGGANALTLVTGGSGYSIAPLVIISAPGNPGVQALATATINGSGVVTSLTLQNAGAGYTVAPTVLLLPNPYDPNFGAIVNATATASLTGAGTITAVLCTWSGAPVGSQPTLAISGAGSSATATTVYVSQSSIYTAYLQPL
jgi:hypothetical protein